MGLQLLGEYRKNVSAPHCVRIVFLSVKSTDDRITLSTLVGLMSGKDLYALATYVVWYIGAAT